VAREGHLTAVDASISRTRGDHGQRKSGIRQQISCAGDELLSYDAGILQSKTGGVFMVIKAFSSETIASWSSRIEACPADVRRM
jgi:hypothetical protein